MSPPLYLSALQRAALVAGGTLALSSRLAVSASCVEAWMDGREPIPPGVFLKIIEMLLEADLASLRASAAPARPDARPSKLFD